MNDPSENRITSRQAETLCDMMCVSFVEAAKENDGAQLIFDADGELTVVLGLYAYVIRPDGTYRTIADVEFESRAGRKVVPNEDLAHRVDEIETWIQRQDSKGELKELSGRVDDIEKTLGEIERRPKIGYMGDGQ